jgi:hypothetical protein
VQALGGDDLTSLGSAAIMPHPSPIQRGGTNSHNWRLHNFLLVEVLLEVVIKMEDFAAR